LYILLCGYPPFNGSTWEQILEKVKKGKFVFTKGWEHISSEAKNLISRMLEYNPAKRISAEEALNDKWVQGNTKKSIIEIAPTKETLKNLQSFKIQSALQSLVMSFIANRFQSQEEQVRLRNEFLNLDSNGDGILQKEELIAAYIKMGKNPEKARETVNAIMQKIDINMSGTVDFSEFLTANLAMHEALADKRLMEAFKLFDKVCLSRIKFENRMGMDKLHCRN